ncbi:EpsG family protein [Ideonella margarita]|uniref:EpsG family protein n=1 Tax=Ideonella margarita TaxID=2984191 RepID=A0ABU9C337_9BURK
MTITASSSRPAIATLGLWLAALAAALLAQTALLWVLLALVGASTARAAGWVRRPWWPAWALVLLLAVINSTKWPDSDLAEYYQYLAYCRPLDWWVLVSDPDSHLSVRVTEPVFRSFVWLLAQLSPAPRISFGLMCSMLIYGMALALSAQVVNVLNDSDDNPSDPAPVVAVCVALLLGVTFSLTAHLVRQYLAGGVFMLAMWHFVLHRRPLVLLWAVVAVLVHNSAVLLWLPLMLAWARPLAPRLFWAMLLLAVILTNAGLVGWLNELTAAATLIKDDGQIGLALPLLDLAVLSGGWWLLRSSSSGQRLQLLWYFCIAFAALLLCIREVPLMFFRTYFFLEFLRVPMLALLLCAGLRRGGDWRAPMAVLALLCAAGLCWTRVQGAEWTYRSTPQSWPEWLQMDRLVDRWQKIEDLRL